MTDIYNHIGADILAECKQNKVTYKYACVNKIRKSVINLGEYYSYCPPSDVVSPDRDIEVTDVVWYDCYPETVHWWQFWQWFR